MLPKSDVADSEDTRSVTKTPSSALHEKRIGGFRDVPYGGWERARKG